MNALTTGFAMMFAAAAIGADSTVTLGCAAAVIGATIGTSWMTGRKWQKFLDRLDRLEERIRETEKQIHSMIRERRMDRDIPSPQVPTHTFAILLVDDDPDDRILFRRGLGPGYDLDECASLAEALVKAKRRHYDCVVIDLYLPDSNGDPISKFLSENPVAVCMATSGTSSQQKINDAIKQGADSFIAKSASYERGYLSRMINQAINRKSIQ